MDDAKGRARSLSALATAAVYRAEYADAATRYAASLEQYTKLGEKRGMAMAWHGLGYVSVQTGDTARAREQLERALVLGREVGDHRLTAHALVSLAETWIPEPESPEASALAAAALGIAIEADLRFEGLAALEVAARILVDGGDARGAARLFGAADAARAVLGTPMLPEERARRAQADALVAARLAPAEVAAEAAAGAALELPEAAREALRALGRLDEAGAKGDAGT